MKTIDETLFELIQARMSSAYDELSDPENWTVGTRDQMVAKSRTLNEQVAEAGIEMIEKLLKDQVDGRSAMYWLLLRGMLMGELELFLASRSQIDTATDEQLKDSPFDHGWLTDQIRTRYQEISAMDDRLEVYVPDSVEEL